MISQLILNVDEMNLKVLMSYFITNIMKINLNMFLLSIEHQVYGEVGGMKIVTPKN